MKLEKKNSKLKLHHNIPIKKSNKNNNNNNKNDNNNCVYSSEPERNMQVSPLKCWVYKVLKSETNFSETATRFTTHWSRGNWSDIEKLETGVRLID